MQFDREGALFVVQRYKFVLIFRTVVRRDSQLDLKHHDRTAEERLKSRDTYDFESGTFSRFCSKACRGGVAVEAVEEA